MAKVNLSQAAKLTGKNRTTIWRHIHSGKLSIERDRDGLPFVDTSELIRVYGELEPVATGDTKKKPHQATYSYEDLIAIVELLRKEQAEMKAEIENLTNRLTYIPELNSKELSPVTQSKKPEDDPDWPKDIKTMADVLLRREITLKIDSTK
ncbi:MULTISPECIES: hypothetical protein [Shewanella]|jgi:hypothetical protein|uniref:hypothetical protein n=1 Tax=Shewanella TaxID=22 RepID=UPI000C4E8759|nr:MULTISPECIES: hypothetical protein [Shewanella]NCQ43401.1 hypothetical protein [Shewanella frigidimarina]NCP38693.1 hypothetical protein [Shewanella vesiculosa]PIP99341.1 MAG: hypothetical protein COW76_16225 [Shewanella sp. CG18_big_fil_WC_8_21_14_2_50_42_11]PIX70667.1 MAG: hypothetical protein COZ42_13615 [Shewanella sp. CG_4_10_14_3_um_filter_42_91]PIY66854.1 MAG: hypothetical protein COY92_08530 [Shewanella sp. CG_4_10_14_0_8_um_filter_42_13]|tara:strand:- start:7404 stop:7856 length:453 start_codon:yes stop_codon:yes gene_type:complete